MLLHLLLAAATAAAATPAPAPAATVNTTTYTGLARNGVDVFLGIRYGQDTSGAQRFRPPRAYAPPANAAVVAATDGGPACAQADSDGAAISEDCLRLNVVRPKGSHPGSRHAVMVFIHGGGFWEGAKDEVLYEPDGAVLESVRSGQPIVHVAINYRLNGEVFPFRLSAHMHVSPHPHTLQCAPTHPYTHMYTHVHPYTLVHTHTYAHTHSYGIHIYMPDLYTRPFSHHPPTPTRTHMAFIYTCQTYTQDLLVIVTIH